MQTQFSDLHKHFRLFSQACNFNFARKGDLQRFFTAALIQTDVFFLLRQGPTGLPSNCIKSEEKSGLMPTEEMEGLQALGEGSDQI